MRRQPTPEQKAASAAKRAELCARSTPIQAARKAGLLPWAELPTVNDCLILIYSQETGQNAWKTFAGWREEGKGVKKGEKGFAIWGRPLGAKEGESDAPEISEALADDGGESEGRGPKFFPLCYLFHAGQVEAKA